MNLPKISIITPSYNQGHFIEETILSVIGQNYPNLEYIIIDGGSTDNTVEIIKKYTDKITYWVSEKDKGQSDAINKGLEKCTGEVFNWINSDDYLEPNSLFEIGKAFQNTEIDVFSGLQRIIQDRTPTNDFWGPTQAYDNWGMTAGYMLNAQPCTFFRLDKIREIGNINPDLHYCMDREMWIRYLMQFGTKKIVNTDKILANFRLHGESKSVTLNLRFQYDNLLIFWYLAKYFDLKNYQKKLEKLMPEGMSSPYKMVLPKNYLRKSQVKSAIAYFLLRNVDFFVQHQQFPEAKRQLKAINPLDLSNGDKIRYFKTYFKTLFSK